MCVCVCVFNVYLPNNDSLCVFFLFFFVIKGETKKRSTTNRLIDESDHEQLTKVGQTLRLVSSQLSLQGVIEFSSSTGSDKDETT